MSFAQCPTCKRFDRLDIHKCGPAFIVWDNASECFLDVVEEKTHRLFSYDKSTAAEEYAERDQDPESAVEIELNVISVEDAEKILHDMRNTPPTDCLDIDDAIEATILYHSTAYVLYGETTRKFYATEKKESVA